MPDIDLELISPTAIQANDVMTVRRGTGPYSMALVTPVTAPVAARIYRNSNQSIPGSGVFANLSWTTAAYEANGEFWTSGSTVTIPEDGYYQITSEATFDGSGLLTVATSNMEILRNGATVIGEDEVMVAIGAKVSLFVFAQRLFTAGDTITVRVKHSDAGALNILAQGDHSPDIILAKLNGAKGDAGPASTVMFARLPADFTLLTQTASQQLFDTSAAGALALDVGVYSFEAAIYLTGLSATSGNGNFNVLGAGTATTGKYLMQSVGVDNNTALATAARGGAGSVSSTVKLSTNATGTGVFAVITGHFEVTSAGTIIPSIALDDLPTAPVAKAGTTFRCTRMADTVVNTQGTWT